jgi:predicted RNA-binding Zn-ribbon protein involved in translation (DUF1610 family)
MKNQKKPTKPIELIIEDGNDYKQKLEFAYQKWSEHNFDNRWLDMLEKHWIPSSDVNNFINLLKARRDLTEEEYKVKEKKIINDFEKVIKMMDDFFKIMKAEEEAFEKAGIKEGTVTYTCPICGGTAVAVRYVHNGRTGGLGSHCTKCGYSHT